MTATTVILLLCMLTNRTSGINYYYLPRRGNENRIHCFIPIRVLLDLYIYIFFNWPFISSMQCFYGCCGSVVVPLVITSPPCDSLRKIRAFSPTETQLNIILKGFYEKTFYLHNINIVVLITYSRRSLRATVHQKRDVPPGINGVRISQNSQRLSATNFPRRVRARRRERKRAFCILVSAAQLAAQPHVRP